MGGTRRRDHLHPAVTGRSLRRSGVAPGNDVVVQDTSHGFGPLDTVLDSGSTPPDVMAAVLHDVLVGPVAPTIDERRAVTAKQ